MIENLKNFMQTIDKYSKYVEGAGLSFTQEGFPIIPRECFLQDFPCTITPWHHRKGRLITNPKHTLICYFMPDERIYPRLEKALEEIPEYRNFMGVIGMDLSVTADMDREWQGTIILLNQLHMAALAVNGIPVVANTRCGDETSLHYLDSIPKEVMWASGLLGCEKTKTELDVSYISKILRLRVGKLCLYGHSDPLAQHQLDLMGINYRRYPDAHEKYRQSKQEGDNGR